MVVPAGFTRRAVTVPLAFGFHGMSLPVVRLRAARWLRATPPLAVPGARTMVKSPPMKILCAATTTARTRPFVCHELAGLELMAAVAAAGVASTATAIATSTYLSRPAISSGRSLPDQAGGSQ